MTNVTDEIAAVKKAVAKDKIKEEDDAATKAGLIVGLSCTFIFLVAAGYFINKKKKEEYA